MPVVFIQTDSGNSSFKGPTSELYSLVRILENFFPAKGNKTSRLIVFPKIPFAYFTYSVFIIIREEIAILLRNRKFSK